MRTGTSGVTVQISSCSSILVVMFFPVDVEHRYLYAL